MNEKSDCEKALCLGAWLASGSPVVAELAAASGVDWVLLDMEHGFLTEVDVLPNLMAFKGAASSAIIRVPSHEPSLIGRILDRGADGIMVPHVDSAEQARDLVRATRLAPQGVRGYSRSTRAHAYGSNPTASNAHPLLFAQIESLAAVHEVDAIAAVDGVDVLFVGPADLKRDLEASGEMTFEAALEEILLAAQNQGKETGIFLRDIKDVSDMAKRGVTRIAVNSDLGILRTAFASIAAGAKID